MEYSVDDHAARFDEKAETYDENATPEYRTAADLVIEHADPELDDVVLDLGTGTGAIGLALADDARQVIGRDISEGMLEEARAKAAKRGLENVSFDTGRFREPDVPAGTDVDVVVSNFAMHHLADDEKRDAIEAIADFEPRRFVLGDVMLFEQADPDEPFYSPDVDDPATVGTLADALTSAGLVQTAVERVHDQVGVLVAERAGKGMEP